MFDLEFGNLVHKSQWIDRSLPKYIPSRVAHAVSSKLGDSSLQLTINSVVIDVIFAFAKNARWHSSPLFLEALSEHLLVRYGVRCPEAFDVAGELLGNSSLSSSEADRMFSVNYLASWHSFSFPESSERLCGIGPEWYETLKECAGLSDYFVPASIMEWFVELQNSKNLWQADEQKMILDSNLNIDLMRAPGAFFSNLFLTLGCGDQSGLDADAIQRLERAGFIYRLEEENHLFSLSVDGQKLTARFMVFRSSTTNISVFLGWCEPWQRCFLETASSARRQLLEAMINLKQLPKVSVIGEFVTSLVEEWGRDFAAGFVNDCLSSHSSMWTRAAMLASSRNLLDQETIQKTALSLFEVPSDEIQRLAADVLFG